MNWESPQEAGSCSYKAILLMSVDLRFLGLGWVEGSYGLGRLWLWCRLGLEEEVASLRTAVLVGGIADHDGFGISRYSIFGRENVV